MLFTTVVVVAALAAVWLVCLCIFRAVSFFIKPLLLIAFGFVSGAIGAHIDRATPPSTESVSFKGAALNTWRAVDNWGHVLVSGALSEGSPLRSILAQIPHALSEPSGEKGEAGQASSRLNFSRVLDSLFPSSTPLHPPQSNARIARNG